MKLSIINEKNSEYFRGFIPEWLEFTEGAPFKAGCVEDGTAVGAVVAELFGNEARLVYTAVSPYWQRKGIAVKAITELSAVLSKAGVTRISAFVCDEGERREIACGLLNKAGFTNLESIHTYAFQLEDVIGSDKAKKMLDLKIGEDIFPFPELSPYHLRTINHFLTGSKDSALYAIDTTGILADLSFVCMRNGEFAGCIIFAPCGEGIEIRWLYGSDPVVVKELVVTAMKAVTSRYPNGIAVYAAALEEKTDHLLKGLFAAEPTGVSIEEFERRTDN